jgi:opacity protein-like surface antigen
MKKALALVVLAVVVGTAAFAIPAFGVSAGAGGFLTKAFGGGVEADASIPVFGSASIDVALPSFGGGAFAFLDLTFVEVGLGISGNSGTMEYEGSGSLLSGSGSYGAGESTEDFSYTAFDISVVGKYPFEVGPVLLFPMVGFNYRNAPKVLDEDGDVIKMDGNKKSNYSALSLLIGGGVDYNITPAIFLRGELLYNIRFASELEDDFADSLKELTDLAKAYGGSGETKTKIGHGPTFKIGVGYKFF